MKFPKNSRTGTGARAGVRALRGLGGDRVARRGPLRGRRQLRARRLRLRRDEASARSFIFFLNLCKNETMFLFSSIFFLHSRRRRRRMRCQFVTRILYYFFTGAASRRGARANCSRRRLSDGRTMTRRDAVEFRRDDVLDRLVRSVGVQHTTPRPNRTRDSRDTACFLRNRKIAPGGPIRTLDSVLRWRGPRECVGPTVGSPRDVVSAILKNKKRTISGSDSRTTTRSRAAASPIPLNSENG